MHAAAYISLYEIEALFKEIDFSTSQ